MSSPTEYKPRRQPVILVVDDEATSREMVIDLIEHEGYAMLEAENGHTAVQAFQNHQPDLILMDARMPGMSGFEACTAIRRLPGGERIPIVILTALDSAEAIEQTFAVGATDYIAKPLNMSLLINRVRTLIRAQQTEATLASMQQLVQDELTDAPFLNRLLSNLPGMAYRSRHAPTFLLEYASQGSMGLVGYPPAELIGATGVIFTDLIHPDDRERVWRQEGRSLEQGQPFEVVYRIYTADKQIRWVLDQGRSVMRDENGYHVIEGFITDVTPLKQMEEEVLRERTLMRTVIDNLPDYIFAKDRAGHFVVSNFANARYVGMQHPNQVVGRKNADFYPPELARRFDLDDQAVMDAGQGVFHWEEETLHPDTGQKHWYAITKAPLPDREGNTIGLVGMIRDVTEAKKGEQEMKLANERLVELNQLKSHFLLKMSHELHTPLNSIIGYTDMLLSGLLGDLTPQQTDRLERVLQNGKHLLSLIDDMLDISKIQTGSMSVVTEHLSLPTLLNECVANFKPLAQQRGLTLETDIAADVPLLKADRAGMIKVLTHLIENGLKFTHKGGVRIYARDFDREDGLPPELEDEAESWVLLVIEDSGIGIPDDKLEMLFNEFRQVDDSPTREYGGTGLGLAISYKLVKLMGGHLWVESLPHQGSTFKILLPAVSG